MMRAMSATVLSRRDAGARMQRSAEASRRAARPDHALALARRIGSAGLRAAAGSQLFRALSRLAFAAAISVLIGGAVVDANLDRIAVAAAVCALAASSLAGFFAELQSARAEALVADGIRARVETSLAALSPARLKERPTGALIAGVQRHPEALAALVVSHAVARLMLGIGPLTAAGAISVISWEAALALVLSLPVMIAFFVLVGGLVRERADAREKAFGRLAAQFSDRIRALPTILANHALDRERGKIEKRMQALAGSTMGVLRIAFLNAGVIDFFSSLSIAMAAVLLGLGHLGLMRMPGFYGLALWQSFFILVVAADFFTPFRRYSDQYHLKAEGEAAAQELEWFFQDERTSPSSAEAKRLSDAFAVIMNALPLRGLVTISGPSGSGKSTMLRLISGIEAGGDEARKSFPLPTKRRDWISTDIYLPAGTLAEAITWNRPQVQRALLLQVTAELGLLDDRFLPGGLNADIAEGGANLSGGQRMRIGIARAMLTQRVVLADEPTAKLDEKTAARVREALGQIARHRLVIVATHDEALIAVAERRHALDALQLHEKAAAP
jgi:ABC-type transport system involved in cytochrome bd biosynthesis fused ATPase/permease subunit